ncbi:hypothetical protein SERLA73DRAFT_162494 [Serpula lacrymans var. lacrymans S7.3]|uniref:Uncharacterized protein n=1 Tax=Serpula lacrymans var. lacrymans (strain S7.3) TaxID=936435 RepID=F8Q841_SERL3|nr:hypothetical protein SERLA73DRAFT_162494 [Serpula lacrymans var. lacrymans S7.3]
MSVMRLGWIRGEWLTGDTPKLQATGAIATGDCHHQNETGNFVVYTATIRHRMDTRRCTGRGKRKEGTYHGVSISTRVSRGASKEGQGRVEAECEPEGGVKGRVRPSRAAVSEEIRLASNESCEEGRKRKVDWKGEKGDSLDAMAYWVRGWWEDGFFRDEESGSDKNGEGQIGELSGDRDEDGRGRERKRAELEEREEGGVAAKAVQRRSGVEVECRTEEEEWNEEWSRWTRVGHDEGKSSGLGRAASAGLNREERSGGVDLDLGDGMRLSHSPSLTVYVDHHGDLHDPDYRHFPPVRVCHPDLHTHHDHLDDHLVPDHHVQDAIADYDYHETRYRSANPYAYDDRSRRRSSSASRTTANAYPTRFTSYAYDDHAPTYRCDDPASYDSPLLPTDEDDPPPHLPLKEKRPPRSRSGDDSIESEVITHDDDDQEAQNEWTPTCTHTLRRQWQALALRLRFGLFRTKRRIKRRVGRSIKGAT